MKKSDYGVILLVLLALIYHHHSSKQTHDPIPIIVVNPEPIDIVPNKPEVINVDQYSQALAKAAKDNKQVLLIFTANWCGHCRSLKKDLPSIDTSKYEVCILDVDDDSSTKLKERFSIKMIPASYIIDPKTDTELKKINGYVPEKYKTWLK